MTFLLPQGIGDAAWALLKIQDIAKGQPIDILIACYDVNNPVEARALEFVRRFRFVNSCEMHKIPILLPGAAADENGLYRYRSDGGDPFVLMPNATLERGQRIETWLPDYKCNWEIMKEFRFDSPCPLPEKKYVCLFLSTMANNVVSGHNRNAIWTPDEWLQLAREIQHDFNYRIVWIGAEYDRDYFYNYIRPAFQDGDEWSDLVGVCGIGETLATIKNAQFVISYQSGLGVAANYMNVPTAMFWRAKGDSISPDMYVSFEEGMASAWTKPGVNYLPLIYGRHGVEYIKEWMQAN